MERTRIALEKARQQRLAAQGRPVAPQRPTGEGLAGDRLGSDGRPVTVAPLPVEVPKPTEIRYHQTQVLRPDPGDLRENRVIAGFIDAEAADLYRMLRAQVLQRLTARKLSTLAVCSAKDGEGKTLVAANLAVSLALDVNQTVLLVDLDFRRPGLHKRFGLRPERGLNDYLLGDVDLTACLINPGIERLVILPTCAPIAGSSETLSSPKMAGLAHELKHRYPDRIVIYDLPPLLMTDDCLVFLQHVDACLLVVEDGATRKIDIERSVDHLSHFNLIGTVLNKAPKTDMRSYYA